MPNPVPESIVREGLNLARELGVIARYELRRGEGIIPTRWWVVTFTDGDKVRWTSSRAEAFGLGVRLTREVC
jgi:hypothetical protein